MSRAGRRGRRGKHRDIHTRAVRPTPAIIHLDLLGLTMRDTGPWGVVRWQKRYGAAFRRGDVRVRGLPLDRRARDAELIHLPVEEAEARARAAGLAVERLAEIVSSDF